MELFKRRVLEPSIKQINEHTDITVTYEQHKKVELFQAFHSDLNRNKKQRKSNLKEIRTQPIYSQK